MSSTTPDHHEAAPLRERERLHIVIAGHVDHGKSTVIGRLLADTDSLPKGKLDAVRALCERTARPFEYAFLLDALRDEQAQGITIDVARVFFRTARRDYVVLDAPGHIEFLKNMVTGSSRAEAAFLVIDAHEGVQENSRRHGYMMGMLGIQQLVVLVNKMDLVDYDQARFESIRDEYAAFLGQIGLRPSDFVPIAARDGENLMRPSPRMPWYRGPSVLGALDAFAPAALPTDQPFRMPVQDVYKFTQQGDDRRIVAGTVDAGRVRVGDEVVFLPSGKRGRVRSFEAFSAPSRDAAAAGSAIGFTLREQIYITRGEVAALADEPRPRVTTRLRVSLFWLGKRPLAPDREYLLKIGTAKVPMRVEAVHRVIDASTLASQDRGGSVGRHDVGECTLQLGRAVAVDLAAEIAATGRFVVVDDYEIAGGGIIREVLADAQSRLRERVLLRNYKWEPSFIAPERRSERYAQRPTMMLVTGPADVDRKRLAKELENRLFGEGRLAYFLGIGNVVYGVDADLQRDAASREEHVRRLAEVANLMLDAGMILIATAADLTEEEAQVIRTSVTPGRIVTVWVGAERTTDFVADLQLTPDESPADGADRLWRALRDAGAFAE